MTSVSADRLGGDYDELIAAGEEGEPAALRPRTPEAAERYALQAQAN